MKKLNYKITSTAAALGIMASLVFPGLTFANAIGPVYPLAVTYVSSAHQTSNYGNSPKVWVDNDTDTLYTIMKFDMNEIEDQWGDTPCTAGSYDASFYMKVDNVSDGNHEIWAADLTPWTETGVKWNNMPGVRGIYPLGGTLEQDMEDEVGEWTWLYMIEPVDSVVCTENDGIATYIIKGGSSNAVSWHSNNATNEADRPYAYFDVGD